MFLREIRVVWLGICPDGQRDQETYRGNPTRQFAHEHGGTTGTTLESTAAPQYTVFYPVALFEEGNLLFFLLCA
jgi:hypothetical protein